MIVFTFNILRKLKKIQNLWIFLNSTRGKQTQRTHGSPGVINQAMSSVPATGLFSFHN